MRTFRDRQEAASLLAEKLQSPTLSLDLVLGIARGGVVLARVIADTLSLPCSALIIRKIHSPKNPELALGATAGKKWVYWEEEILKNTSVSSSEAQKYLRRAEQELSLRKQKIHPPRVSLKGKNVLVVDDGVATGATVIAAARLIASKHASSCFLATPLLARDRKETLLKYYTHVIVLQTPVSFHSVSEFYEFFPQVTDEEVRALLS